MANIRELYKLVDDMYIPDDITECITKVMDYATARDVFNVRPKGMWIADAVMIRGYFHMREMVMFEVFHI